MNDIGSIAVFAIVVLLLIVMTQKMDMNTCALIVLGALFFLMCRGELGSVKDGFTSGGGFVSPMDSLHLPSQRCALARALAGDQQQSPMDGMDGEGAPNPEMYPCVDSSPPEPVYSPSNDPQRARIEASNRAAINEVYGRKYAGTIDDALYKHKQRIGDRDRQATINQISARRNNVYRPFYEQELREQADSGRWWESNEDVLVTKLEKHQLDTIDVGRSNTYGYDIDGTYYPYAMQDPVARVGNYNNT